VPYWRAVETSILLVGSPSLGGAELGTVMCTGEEFEEEGGVKRVGFAAWASRVSKGK